MDSEAFSDLRANVVGGAPLFVRWRPEVAEAVPELADAVQEFNPGTRPSALACTEWLWEHALVVPQESTTRL